ncbi:translocation/assembly module TamB domain-containing protein [Calidithermus roseus]|uniref:translocation/assembly module TamB domain-containing protein n=1 Tax=Calidithermus roseus TaxID=1644118 RepID=UPI0011C433A7|nr:translocation/assembly module TamB domain-containing protein [Calidithermus roseus]
MLFPALPPVQSLVLGEILKAAGFQGEWRGTGGYLLTGLEVRGVRLQKPGIKLEGERIQLEYGLTGLFRRELPIRVRLKNGKALLDWEEVFRPQPPAAEPQIKLKVDELKLEGVEVGFDEAKKLALPPLKIVIRGDGPTYTFTATLPAGSARGQLRRTGREFEAWEVRAEGEVRALSYWYSGLEGGSFQTRWTLSPRGIEGHSRLEDAQASIVGLTITHISGPVDFKHNVVTANLTGSALGAPVVGDATVDIDAQNYSFRVQGRPKLAELARSYGLVLPVEGGGPLVLEGRGWESLVITGEYEGQGRLVNEPLSYKGTLGFDKVFRLDAAIQGRFFDRTYVAGVKLVGQDYTVDLKDSLGSLLQLTGQGNATRGQGRLTLPKPLLGEAGVSFRSQGSRWSAEVLSRPVNLPPIARPFDLSGRLTGDGNRVQGWLGQVGLSGSWDNLALDLGRLELLVGSLSGKGSLKGGRFSADLLYDSDYTRFPLAVRQEGRVWRFSNDYASGQFAEGVLDLSVSRLPLRLGTDFVLSGEVRYARNQFSGDWRLLGDWAEVAGVLEGLGTRYSGEVRTPLGSLPLQGMADGRGVRASLDTLQIRAGSDGMRVQGPLKLGFIQAKADLTYQGGLFGGTAQVATPWLEARLEGRGRSLWADTSGYARLSGPLWPGTALQGRLTLPDFGPLKVVQVPVRLDLKEARIGEGRVQLGGKFPFALALPVEIAGQDSILSAQGDLEQGSLRLRHPWGEVQGRGAWKALQVRGGFEVPLLGQVGLAGSADLFRAAYSGRLDSSRLGGELRVWGQGANLSYRGNFQRGKLVLDGAYARELRLRLEAKGYDLQPLGVPGKLEGTWGERGGSLRLDTPYGQLSAQGSSLLGRLSLSGDTRWGTLRAFADARGLSAEARLAIPHLSGTLRLEGPWSNLQARGSGDYALPYLEPAQWSLSADVRRQTWSLEGPLQLRGQGLKYQGHLRWSYAALGRQGLLTGELSGESTDLKAELAGHFAGVPLRLSAQLDQPSLEGLRAQLTLPEGQATLRQGRVNFDLETAPLAKLFDQPIRGRLKGEIGLDATGQASGELVAWDRRVRLDYQDRQLTAFLPEQALGARLRLPTDSQMVLEGLGDLRGSVQVLPVPSGELRYSRQGWELEVRAAGSRERPSLDLEAHGPWGDLRGQAALDVRAQTSQGRLRLHSDWAQADLGFATEGTRYRLRGGLEPRQYLKQPGTLEVEGEGSRWSASWSGATLRLVAAGVGARLEQARLSGQAELEALQRRFALDGDLLYTGRAISGALGIRAEQAALVLEGLGEGLEARGEVFGVAVDARSDLEGRLSGNLRYQKAFGRARLEASARLAGTLSHPEAEGTGQVLGEGAAIRLGFGYQGQPWLEAQGSGVSLSYRAGVVGVRLDTDLGPFTGLPVRVHSQGEGPLESLVLPLKLSGEGLEARGQLRPLGLQASLEGSYRSQQFALRYDKQLQAELKGPYLRGQVRLEGNRPSGLLDVDLPIPHGRLVGEADLERGTVRLEGREGWRGELSAELLGGYSANPTVQIDGDLQGLFGLEARLRARPAQREVEGEARLSLPEWGAVRLVGRGQQVEVQGLEPIAPLRGTLDLGALSARWSYDGELPKGLGELEARGVYPGQWLQGRWSLYGKTLELRSQDRQLLAQGAGLSARVSPAGLEGRLQGFSYGEVTLDGEVEGPWSRLGFDLGWKALGRSGKVQGSYTTGQLEATLQGDLAGQVAYGQGWSGELRLREGTLTLSGEKPIPTVQARALGLTASLEYPRLRLSTSGAPGLEVDLATRRATGRLRQWGVSFEGQERSVIASYPLGEGQLRAVLGLEDFAVELMAPGLGEGLLEYRHSRLSGQLEAALYGLELRLEGNGDKVALSGQHGATEWLPWKQGRLEGSVSLGGEWQLDYRAVQGEEVLRARGKGAEGRLEAEGRWLRGNLAYGGADAGWKGGLGLDLPLEPISARLKLDLQAQQELRAKGSMVGTSGEIDLEASLGREGPVAQATLKEVLIEELPLLSDRVPFLRGRITGRASYRPDQLEVVLQSQGLEVRSEKDPLDIDSLERKTRQERRGLPLKLTARYQGGGVEGEFELGNSRASVRRVGDELDVRVRASAFPLHWLVSAWAGTLDGEATWTGEANLRYNLKDFWKSQGSLIGQALHFSSSKESLQGQAVFRFAGERFYVERLQLDGAGSWRGQGYLGRRGSDFELRLEDTTFTPVLQVVPQLRPYVPEGSGTVLLTVRGQELSLDLENFKFKLGPVAAETPRARLRIGETAQAEGRLKLTAPYPAEADLSGSGSLSNFTINAKGQANLPLLPPNQPFTLTFGYPGYTINAEMPNQSARLYLSLFPNLAGALVGELPVSYPRYFLKSGQVYAGVNIQQEQGVYKLNGTIEVLRAELGLPPGETEVSIPATTDQASSTATRSPVEFVNLQVMASRGVLIQEPLLNGELAGDVYLNGPLGNPYLTGSVVPLQGNIRLWDRNFTILSSYQDTTSEAVFSPDKGILPDVTLVAQTKVPTERGNVEVTALLKSHFVREDGRIKARLEPTFSATHPEENRPLTLAEIAGVLIFGRIDAQTDVQNLATSAGVALTNFLVGQIEGQLAQALGLDRVVVTVRGLGDGERFEETTLTFGKYITPELYLQTQVDFQFRVNFLAEYQLDGLRIRFGLDNLGSAYPNLNFGLGYLFTPNFGLDLSLRSEQQGGQTDNRFGIGLQIRF